VFVGVVVMQRAVTSQAPVSDVMVP